MKAEAISTLTVALLLLGVAAGGVASHVEGPAPDAELTFWRPSDAELSQLRDVATARLAEVPPRETYQPLLDATIRYNQAAAALDQFEYQQGLVLLEKRLAKAARAFVAQHGTRAYLAVGTTLSEQLYRDLAELAEGLSKANLPLQDWLVEHGDDVLMVRLRGLSGRFLERAVGSGLINHYGGPERDRLLVARTLWLEHWAIVAGMAPEAVLEAVETRLTLRWKIEAAEHLSLARRRELLQVAAARLPDYPAAYVEGVLLLQAGEDEAALERFRFCIEQDVEVDAARAWVRRLRAFSWDSLL